MAADTDSMKVPHARCALTKKISDANMPALRQRMTGRCRLRALGVVANPEWYRMVVDNAPARRSCVSMAAFVCLAGAPAVLAGCAAQPPVTGAPQPSWTQPIDLEGVPSHQAIRWPILTSFRDTVYVAANVYPVPLSQGKPVGERPMYLAQFPGGAIPAPPGSFQFIYPKLLKAPNGDLHMVWAERDSVVSQALLWPGPWQNALWHAVFANGRWSAPREILRASALEWSTDDGHLALDGAGNLHAVVWRSEPGQDIGIVHLRQEAASWRADLIPRSVGKDVAAVMK